MGGEYILDNYTETLNDIYEEGEEKCLKSSEKLLNADESQREEL